MTLWETCDGVRFVAKDGGKVHVVNPGLTGIDGVDSLFESGWSDAEVLWRMPLGRTLCGRQATMSSKWDHMAFFPDDQLCVSCVASVPDEHRPRLLFSHPL